MTFLRPWNNPGWGPPLVFPGGSTVWTEQTPAEDAPVRERPHDAVGFTDTCGCRMIECH